MAGIDRNGYALVGDLFAELFTPDARLVENNTVGGEIADYVAHEFVERGGGQYHGAGEFSFKLARIKLVFNVGKVALER